MQQERHVVFLNGQIALVDVGGKRQGVELRGFQRRTRGVVHHFAVVHVAGAGDFRERLSLRVLDHGVVEFAAHDEVNIRAGQRGFPPA